MHTLVAVATSCSFLFSVSSFVLLANLVIFPSMVEACTSLENMLSAMKTRQLN